MIVGLLQTSRADMAHVLALVRAFAEDPAIDAVVLRPKSLARGDSPIMLARSMGAHIDQFARQLAPEVRNGLDYLVLVGDRFETFAAAVAATFFNIPLVHIAGGDSTEGAFDDNFRWRISHLSHLHGGALPLHRDRLISAGEDSRCVTVTGIPSLDLIAQGHVTAPEALTAKYHLKCDEPPLVVIFHPVTREYEQTERYANNLACALLDTHLPMVVFAPNQDTFNSVIRRRFEALTDRHQVYFFEGFKPPDYFGLLSIARALVGNSSSGVLEAASFKLPVVNIGSRQAGRLMPPNVVSCGYESGGILTALQLALMPFVRLQYQHLVNPYGDGHAGERILAALKDAPSRQALLQKRRIRGG